MLLGIATLMDPLATTAANEVTSHEIVAANQIPTVSDVDPRLIWLEIVTWREQISLPLLLLRRMSVSNVVKLDIGLVIVPKRNQHHGPKTTSQTLKWVRIVPTL